MRVTAERFGTPKNGGLAGRGKAQQRKVLGISLLTYAALLDYRSFLVRLLLEKESFIEGFHC